MATAVEVNPRTNKAGQLSAQPIPISAWPVMQAPIVHLLEEDGAANTDEHIPCLAITEAEA